MWLIRATVRALVQLGAAEIGESRVQEAKKKIEALQLPEGARKRRYFIDLRR